jgi:hypothetical protein
MHKGYMDTLVDDVLCSANLPPRYVNFLRTELIEHYNKVVIDVSDDYPLLASELYGLNDNVVYSIFALSYVDREYLMLLMRHDDVDAKVAFMSLVKLIKSDGLYQREKLGEIIVKVGKLRDEFKDLVNSCVRTSRKATGSGVKEVTLPSKEELQRFYECGRKVAYPSLEALQEALQVKKQGYLCKHCGFYHQGSQPTGQEIPEHIMYGRWVTNWRRKNNV